MIENMNPRQSEIFQNAVNQIALQRKRPLIYGPNGKPARPAISAEYQQERTAAKRVGSMSEWAPRGLYGSAAEARDREVISRRAIDLVQNDPNAHGVIETFATTVIGTGLSLHPVIDADALGMSKAKVKKLKAEQKLNFATWAPESDYLDRYWFGAQLFILEKLFMKFGEYFILLPMMDDPTRAFSLALNIIHPMRIKTPTDKINTNVRDGIELDSDGRELAIWIKKSIAYSAYGNLSDMSENFHRVERKAGHRLRYIHYYDQEDPDQTRGISKLAPAMKFFKDMSDLLDSELVSNVVTAAFALYIETGDADPQTVADSFGTITNVQKKSDGSSYNQKYEEIDPGSVMYGRDSDGKPHVIAADRPGTTFDPFTRIIKKALAQGSGGVPMPVLFKDFDGMNFASYRSAMLEAWRIYLKHRSDSGHAVCDPINYMLQEEAWLRGKLSIRDFYKYGRSLTQAKWIGPPKGQIEPIKETQADILKVQNNFKTREQVILESNDTGFEPVAEQLGEEQKILAANGLTEEKIENPADDGKTEDF